MTTFNDWVEKSIRRVFSGQTDWTVQTLYGIDEVQTTIYITPSNATAMRVGAILSVDYEIMYVVGYNSATGAVEVVRGFEGSEAVPHVAMNLIYIQPKYTRFDVAQTLNDELNRLSSPDMGLFQVGVSTVTYNPVYMGYDLGTIPTDFIDILEVRHKIPFPTRNYPKISKWKVLRSIPDESVFPSGAGIVIYEGGYPGQPIFFQYSAPFTPVSFEINSSNSGNMAVNSTTLLDASGSFTSADVGKVIRVDSAGGNGLDQDDLITTIASYVSPTEVILTDPCTTAAGPTYYVYAGYPDTDVSTLTGMQPSATDIPPLGAEIQLTLPREIKRNFMESQPDPRKPTEVLATNVSNSVAALQILYTNRVAEEAARLMRQYTRTEGW